MTDLQKILLHIKSLLWCSTKAGQQYNLGLITASLSEGRVLESLQNTNLGDNLAFILSILKRPKDRRTLIACLEALPKSSCQVEVGREKYEIGHYLQALEDLASVPKGSYGLISRLNKRIRGLFYVEGSGLIETTIKPEQVRVIYGTTI
jgi:hypothetical protein